MITVAIELDRPRNMKLTNGALRLIHERTGRNLYRGENILEGFSPDTMGFFLYALLRHEDKTLTEEKAVAMSEDCVGPEVLGKIADLIRASIPDRNPEEAPGPLALVNGVASHGSTSKPSAATT